MTKPCPQEAEWLDYVAGRVAPDSVDALASHLDDCAACQATVRKARSGGDTLVTLLKQSPVPGPYDDAPQLRQALEPPADSPRDAHDVRTLGGRTPDDARQRESDSPAAAPPPRTRSFGPYEIIEELGRGGMGVVYKALQPHLDRLVAIKMLPNHRMGDPAAVARFQREMKAVGKLDHPNIVRAYNAGELGGQHYLVIEYVEGVDLSCLVARLGALPPADACEMARQVAIGLEHANNHGLVHRDIKPSNLMLSTAGHINILDLGLAMLAEHGPIDDLTGTDQLMGTLDYRAPEQAEDSHAVDIRADIYSLGCTLYELLTGAAPFRGPKYNTPLKKILAHARTQPRPIRECVPSLPAQLAQVVERMLAKSPSDRFATPDEVAQALAPFTAGGNLPALAARYASAPRPKVGDPRALTETLGKSARAGTKPGSPPAPPQSQTPPPRRPRHRYLAGAAAALVACAAIVIIVKDRHDKELARLEVPDAATLSIELKPDLKPNSANSKRHPGTSAMAKARPRSADQPLDPKPASVPKRSVEATTSHLGPAGFVGHPLAIAGLRGWNIVKRGSANFDKHAVFHPKEPIVATAGAGGLIRICDAATLAVRRVMMTPGGEIENMAWSPDGTILATVDNELVRLWQFPSGRMLHCLDGRGPSGPGVLIRFSPDGTILATGGRGRPLQVWGVGDAALRKTFSIPDGVVSLAWDAAGRRLAVHGARERALQFIDILADTKEPPSSAADDRAKADAPRGLSLHSWGIGLSADGTKIAYKADDGALRVYDANSLESLGASAPLNGDIYDLAWSPKGNFLAGAHHVAWNNSIYVWDASTLKVAREYKTQYVPHRVCWSADGEQLLASGVFNEFANVSIRALDREEALVPEKPLPAYADDATIAWAPVERRFAIGVGSRVDIWDAATCTQVEAYSSAGGRPLKMAWSPDGSKLAAAIRGHRFGLWDTATHEFLDSAAHQSPRPRLAWLSDSDGLVTNGGDGDAIQRWHTNDGKLKPLGTLTPTLKGPLAVSASRGQIAALTPDGKEVAVYDLAGGKLLRRAPAFDCRELAWSDERNLLIATHGTRCLLHDPTGKTPSRHVEELPTYLCGVAWSPTGKQIAGAGQSWLVVVWDVATGKKRHTLYGHDRLVWTTTWSPDGRVLASHGSDGTTRFWNPANGRLWGTLLRVDDEVALIGSNGHVRASQAVVDQLAYVAQTDEGQETLTQEEFETRFGWKNDPDKLRMIDFDEAEAKQ